MKKAAVIFLSVILLVTTCTISVLADSDIKIIVNGTQIKCDTPPTIENGRTLVPARAVFEALGAHVQWVGETKTVIATKGENVVKLQIDNNVAQVNEDYEFLDVPAKIIDSRTYVPARFSGEIFGVSVLWDGSSRSVIINDYSSIPCVEQSNVDTRPNDEGAWWGENITKIARNGDMAFTFAMDSRSGHRTVYLCQRQDGGAWVEGEAFDLMVPPNILVDAMGYVHIIGFEPFDELDQHSGRIFHAVFNEPNTVRGDYKIEYLTTADRRKESLTLDNYGTAQLGAAIGKDDTILAAYTNSLLYNAPGTNSIGARIYDPADKTWTYETVSKDMLSQYCYPFAYVSDDYFHVYAVEDDYDSDYADMGAPYNTYLYRYGAIKHWQRPRAGGEWTETTLIDFNEDGIDKGAIWAALLRAIDFTVDSEGTVHALVKFKGDYDGSRLDFSRYTQYSSDMNKCYHYWKAEGDSVWQHEQICPGTSLCWAKLWERDDGKLFFVTTDNTCLYLVPSGTSEKYLISKLPEDLYYNGATPFVFSSRSSACLSRDLHMVLYADDMTRQALYIEVDFDTSGNIDLPLIKTNTISGTISMPAGEVAPAGGLLVPVCASTIEAGYQNIITYVTIPQGSSSAGYSLTVNTNFRYRVWYDLFIDNTNGYDQWGVYTTDGMKEYIKLGTLLDVTHDIGNIDLTLYYKQ